jgi:predicted DNA binding CopG/RHH family protein
MKDKDQERLDGLLDRDWGDAWEGLPPAPSLVLTQPKTAQVTLRVPAEMVTALRDVARRKALPYHALARSLIAEGLRGHHLPTGSDEAAALSAPGDTQLNIKLAPELLEELKRFSDESRRPYHRLARLWLEAGLRQELATVASSSSIPRPSLKELLILLLDSPGPRGGDPAVRGMTRLQKLLFVIDKQLGTDPSRFYAHNYGPFDEQVNDAADALQMRGLVQGITPPRAAPPTVEEMMASVLRHAGPRVDEVYALTAEGRAAAAELRRKDKVYARLAEQIQALRKEWDRPDLVERVYDAFPEYTGRSLIKDKVARRAAARRKREER